MTVEMPGVLIAEDDVLLREGLARLLADEGFRVIDRPAMPRRCSRSPIATARTS